MGTTEERIAEFVADVERDEIPDAAMKAAHRSVFDAVGCMLAAAARSEPQAAVRFAAGEGGLGPAGIVGTDVRTSRSMAALANGTLAHWLDYDDGRTAAGHAAAVLTPAALAVGEPAAVSGDELLAAYAIALEVVTHLSDACTYEEKTAGFHRTSLFGAVGATVLAARLARLDAARTQTALGIIGSMTSGVCQNFGTYTKPLHAGLAARSAVSAVALAEDRWTASPDILAGPVGWAAAHLPHFDYGAMARDLGIHWRTAKTWPLIKAYPCCGASHGPLDALLSLRAEHGFTLDDVESVDVQAQYDSMVMMVRRPRSGFEGKFSLLYTLATALVDGRVDVDSFTDERLARPEYERAAARIHIHVSTRWETTAGNGSDHSRVKPGDRLPVVIRLRDGRTLTRAAERIEGLRTAEEVRDKFTDNARRVLSPPAAEHATNVWSRLDEVDDVGKAVRSARPGDRS